MNYFVEGLQGSGKSTLVQKLSELHPDLTAVHEGDYSPVELAWCAYVDEAKYQEILEKYSEIRELIEAKTFAEEEKRIICYTQIITDIPGFHKDLEQYEIYNNRIPYDEFRSIILNRYRRWTQDGSIFECSLFQNIIENLILFMNKTDDEIIDFYKEVREALEGKEYQIIYLKAEDVKANLDVIRKERSDDQGKELWFPLMMGFFNNCPYSTINEKSGEEDLIKHFEHRQELELRICEEVFKENFTLLSSKKYTDGDIKIQSQVE